MAGIGDLVARLSVDSAPFTRGLGSAKGALKSFAGGVGTIIKGGVVAGLGLATVAVFKLKQQMSELDGIAKLSARTGFDPKTIAGFGFAVEQSGGSVESANKALDKFTKNMGEAMNGSGPAKDAIADMGLSLEDIVKQTPEQQLLTLSQAISELPTEAQRAAAAVALFGKGGQEMVGVFANGEQGIKDFMDEADGLGLGFSKEELADVEAANDAMNRMSRAVGAVASAVTVKVAPALESMFTGISDAAASMGGFGAMADSVFSFIGDSWNWLQDTISYGITAALAIGEWALTNWQAIGELAFKSVALGVVSFASAVGFFFTTEMPAYLAWFSDNFGSVIFTAVDYTLTTFINLGQNIRNIWQAVLDFFSTGEFAPDWTPLLEGAHSAISKMPDIPARIVGDVEAALSQDVAALKSTLAVSFDETVGERLRTLDEMQKMDREKPKLTKPDPVAKGSGSGGGEDDAAAAESKKKSEPAFSGVMGQGSSEAFALLARSQRNSPQVTEQKKTNRYLKKMADKKTEPVFAPEGIG
jgi:hypothetical protein